MERSRLLREAYLIEAAAGDLDPKTEQEMLREIQAAERRECFDEGTRD